MTSAETGPPAAFNFAAHVLALNAGRADKTAYIDDRGHLSYGALAERVRRCAAGLLALGLRREERVLLLMHDSLDWPVAFLGALYAGIVPVPVNTLLPAGDYRYLLQHSRARALLVSQALWPVAREALATLTEAPAVVVCGDAAPAGTLAFSALLAAAPLAQAADTRADDIAFWLYSSGSTGRPKGAVHSHANLHWTNALYAQPVLRLSERDTVFSAAKLFFAYGLGNALTFALSAGATVVLMAERATPAAVMQRLVAQRVSVFFAVPTLYVSLLDAAASPAPTAPTRLVLRLAVSAGEALPRETGERFREHFGVDLLDGLGSTESLHIFISNREGDVHYGCAGRPLAGYEVELRGDDGAPVAPGQIGELYVKGPSTALLYWSDSARSRRTFQGEWLKSGDKFSVDARGVYRYAGRSDDMLKVSGQYVSPTEVEASLMTHAAVLEAAVVAYRDDAGLTRIKACVVLRAGIQGSPALAAALRAHVKARLAPHKAPRVVEFLAELPRTATGKIQRFRLREHALAA